MTLVDSICRLVDRTYDETDILSMHSIGSIGIFSKITRTHLIRHAFLHRHPKNKHKRTHTNPSRERTPPSSKIFPSSYFWIQRSHPRFLAAISSASRSAHRIHRALGREHLQALFFAEPWGDGPGFSLQIPVIPSGPRLKWPWLSFYHCLVDK